MLPDSAGGGWTPVQFGEAFEPLPAIVPAGSLAGAYRDFSAVDPTGATQPLLVDAVTQGAENTASGVASIDPNIPGAVVHLEQRNVYGVILVDRVTILRSLSWRNPRPRPDSTFTECEH